MFGRKIKNYKFKLLNYSKYIFLYKILILIGAIFKFIKVKIRRKEYKIFSDIIDDINKYEYRKFSQNNEDGIIEYILKKTELKKINFVEIGFDFYENNSLNLFKETEKGLLIDADHDKCFLMKAIIFIFYFFKNIKVENSRVNKNNINDLIIKKFGNDKVDILSIDTEGWELEVMMGFDQEKYLPKVIVLENFQNNLILDSKIIIRSKNRTSYFIVIFSRTKSSNF